MGMRLRSDLFRSGVRVALCAALVSGALVAGAVPASAECESIWVRAYDVSMKVDRDVYGYGDTVVVEASVTRMDTGAPVANAGFVAHVSEKQWVAGIAYTDAAGHAVARLKVRRKDFGPGPVELNGIAFEEVVDTTCATVTEYGEQTIPDAFRVKP
jgi:hypothetical protein